jgi:hypothetical protein
MGHHVENCLTARIREWIFPKPKGGGFVIVIVPFNLAPATD